LYPPPRLPIDIFPTFRGLFEHFLPRGGGAQLPSQMSVTGGGQNFQESRVFTFFPNVHLQHPSASKGGGSSDKFHTFRGLFEHFVHKGGGSVAQPNVCNWGAGEGKKYPNITGFKIVFEHPFPPPPWPLGGGGSSDIFSTFRGLF
jgi:hypothetical protein